MIKLAVTGMLGTTAMIALQAETLDPSVAVLREELMKTLPAIAGAKAQMEGIVGKAIGPETLLIALFIVFCGRGVVMIADKAFDEWRLTLKERRERDREEWELGIPPERRTYPPRLTGSAKKDRAT